MGIIQEPWTADYIPDSPFTVSVPFDSLSRFIRDCVYGWRRGHRYLYIGVSANALARLANHNVIGAVEPVHPGDMIDFWFQSENQIDMNSFESWMIKKHKPKYNMPPGTGKEIECPRCRRMFQPKRYWQRWCSRKCYRPLTIQERRQMLSNESPPKNEHDD